MVPQWPLGVLLRCERESASAARPRIEPGRARTGGLVLVGFLVLCFAVAGIAGAVTSSSVETWYATLEKPTFTPPDRAFGPVWTALFAMMALAAWLVWR